MTRLELLACRWKGYTLVDKYGEVYGEITPCTSKKWDANVLLGDDWYFVHPPCTSKKEAKEWVEEQLLKWRKANPMAFQAQQADQKQKHCPMVPFLVEIPKDLVEEVTKYLLKKGCTVSAPAIIETTGTETYTVWTEEMREAARQRQRAIWATRREKKARLDAKAKRLKELSEKVASGAVTLSEGLGTFIGEIVGHRNFV